MKTYHLQIDGLPYEVTVGALDSNPVQVTVNGEPLEVWLEEEGGIENARVSSAAGPSAPASSAASAPAPVANVQPTPPSAVPARLRDGDSHQVLAPIPGVITDLYVEPGQAVNPGESLCSLEAMKMKNLIRAARTGEIAAVHVHTGQHVSHQQLLMEYARTED